MWGVGTPDSCWNFWPSELPTYVGTPDSQGIWKLAVGLWSSIPDTSGMNTGHVRYDLDSELSKLFKLPVVGTPDHCWNFRPSELPTCVRTPHKPTREQHFYSYWANTGHVRYAYQTGQTSNKSVSSFVSQTFKSHMGWLEHLWNIIYQHDASLLIVRHTY